MQQHVDLDFDMVIVVAVVDGESLEGLLDRQDGPLVAQVRVPNLGDDVHRGGGIVITDWNVCRTQFLFGENQGKVSPQTSGYPTVVERLKVVRRSGTRTVIFRNPGFRVEQQATCCQNAGLLSAKGRRFPAAVRQISSSQTQHTWHPDMDRARIERQVKLAEQKLADWVKKLDGDKVAADQRPKNPKWRSLDADVRQLKRRLLALQQVEEREAAAIERKNQAAAAADE